MPFVKGKSGNPGGRPKVNPEVQALLDEYTPEAIRTLGAIMRDTQAQASARCTAALGLLRKTLPDQQAVDHSGEITQNITGARWLTEAELQSSHIAQEASSDHSTTESSDGLASWPTDGQAKQ
jgi:hypothetical protein